VVAPRPLPARQAQSVLVAPRPLSARPRPAQPRAPQTQVVPGRPRPEGCLPLLFLLLFLPRRRQLPSPVARQLPPPLARHRRWRRHATVAVAAAGRRPLRGHVVLEEAVEDVLGRRLGGHGALGGGRQGGWRSRHRRPPPPRSRRLTLPPSTSRPPPLLRAQLSENPARDRFQREHQRESDAPHGHADPAAGAQGWPSEAREPFPVTQEANALRPPGSVNTT